MRKLVCTVAAIVLSAGLVSLVSRAMADDGNASDRSQASNASVPLALPSGFSEKKFNDSGIRSEFATVTQDALTTDHYSSFINDLVDEDRTRLQDDKKRDVADINGKINVIRKFWKDKYGKDFSIDRSAFTPEAVAIVTGEVSDVAQAVQNWPLDARTGRPMQPSGEAVTARAAEAGKTGGGRVNLDKGRDVAIARFAASHNLPEITVSMVHELPAQWRFDIPKDRTGQQIHNDLLNQLNFIATHSEDWPSDVNDSYRMVAHRVLLSLYGVDANMRPDHKT
jgi:hypothetical protein